MKKISLLTAALFTSTIVAATADMAVPVVPAAPCPPTPCPCPKAFQGFSLGGSFGYGIAAVRDYTLLPDRDAADGNWHKVKIGAQGFDGGLLIGYNYVFNNKFGLGLDVYFNWASTQGAHSSSHPEKQTVGLKNAIQIRVPFSYVICNLVAPKVYFGWDNASWSATTNIGNGATGKSNTSRYNGFLWGAGVDFLLAKHVISGLEYTGVISQNKTMSLTGAEAGSVSIRPMYNTVKATLKFIY